MSRWPKILCFGCIISCMIVPGVLSGKAYGNDAAERTKVKADSLAVHSRPATAGKVVNYLKKGVEVLTNVELTGSDGVSWCNVLREWDMATIGYVQCESLERTVPAKPERWRALPSVEKPSPAGKQGTPESRKPAEVKPSAQAPKSPEQPASPPAPAQPPQGAKEPIVFPPTYPGAGQRMGY